MAAKSKMYSGQIPFSPSGDLLGFTYAEPGESDGCWEKVKWRDNFQTELHLAFTGFSRGRSSAKAHFVGSDGCKYEMFLTDLGDILTNGTIINGEISGKFEFCKRGQNYGIKPVVE